MEDKQNVSRTRKVQYWRILKIDEAIRQGNFPNSNDLAEKLEVDPRTIKRDIEYLRDFFDAPVHYDAGRRGYCYTSLNFFLPAISLTEEELSWLSASHIIFEQFKRTPFYDTVKKIFDKIGSACPANVSINPAWLSGGLSSVSESGTEITKPVWDAVFQALHNKKAVRFTYRAPGLEPVEKEVEPYHVLCMYSEWYIIGESPSGMRTYAFSRMSAPQIDASSNVVIPKDFSIKTYMKGSFGIYRSDKIYTVKIYFSKAVSGFIRERVWHESQELKENKDGTCEITIKVNHLLEVKRWVLSWGKEARVLQPKMLVDEIKQDITAMSKGYGK